MSSIILEAKSLTKEYKQTLALDHINLQIKKGKIYGFIGQNGAGKTTFLRLVTGLAFPTSGTLSLWGNSGTEELQKQRKRIGSMIETPALFPSMTAYQNMEVQRIQRGIREFGRFGVVDVGMFFYNIIKAIIYSCLLNSAIFLIAILICCYLQDAVKATSVTAIIIFGLSLYLGYGMMLRLPVSFLPTYQIRIVVSMKTFFQPIAILVGCIWSGILVLLSWIKFCKCDFK